jgi:tetratricopeptide (TPR) repeat protein
LAKLLDDSNARQQQMPDNPEASRGRSTAITTPQQSDFATRTGSVLGTLAYMPPEQADGAIHKLDARSDVFGLGAILCQILTGQPPYRSSDANELFQLAQRGDVAVAFAALDSCGADPELVTLCKRCLALNQKDRPMDGREVAIEVARFRRAAEERARQAELELALAIVREREQRNRRRLWFGLAASLLVGMITSLGFALWAEYTRRQAVEANTLAQRQLNQIEKDAQLIAGIFSDVDLDELEEEGKPLKLVFADRFEKVAHELDTEAVGDPLILAKLQTTLGNSLLSFGRPKLASILLEKALTVRMQGLGTNHPDTLLTMNSLATAYKDDHQYEKAIPLFEETLKRTQTKLGRNHPDVLTLMNNLAQVYQEVGKLDRAIPLHEETLRLRQENLGRENRHTLFSMSNLALAYHVSGRLHYALPLSEECLRLRSQMLGRQHPKTLTSINNLAGLYKDLKRFDEAVKLYTEALELREKMLGSHHPLTLTTKHNLASAYYFFGKPEKALPHFEEVYRLRKASLKAEHPDNVNSLLCLIWVYLECQRADDATPLIKEYVTLLRQQYGAESSQFAAETTVLARMLLQAGKSAEAEAYLRECLAIRQKLQPDAWSTFYTQSLLGEALLGQKQYVEAESLLLSGYAGMKERTLSIPPQSKHRLTEALDRLITLYTAIDKPDQAKKWQAEKEKLP